MDSFEKIISVCDMLSLKYQKDVHVKILFMENIVAGDITKMAT